MSPARERRAEVRLNRRVVYRGRIVDLFVDTVRRGRGLEHIREVVGHRAAAAVVPLLEGGRLLLVRQFRYAVGRWLWEIPAGLLDDGETPAAAARRELREETGYRAKHLTPLASVLTSPGFSREWAHVFLGTGLTRAGVPKLDADEVLTAKIMPVREALRLIRRRAMTDAKTVLGITLAAQRLGLG